MIDPMTIVAGIFGVSAVACFAGWELSTRAANSAFARADRFQRRMIEFRDRAIDAEDRLRKIELTRHHAAKAGRAAQIAQRAAKLAETTARLKAEVGR